jgi:1-acyl-sn-glycerol-3-phosphate acyltransferase
VDPKRDSEGAVTALKERAPLERHGLLIFPEGHRTKDGAIRPFKLAGIQAILTTRPMPVYAVVTDGFWVSRRLVDFIFNVHKIRGETEVIGPFECPSSEAAMPAFVEELRRLMIDHLAGMRERSRAAN